ncbi:hypothetical protein HDU87_004228, partial [Geranomyces variabilis]
TSRRNSSISIEIACALTVVRVLGDGVIVPTPHTHIHHHHARRHAPGERCDCAAAPHSPIRASSMNHRESPSRTHSPVRPGSQVYGHSGRSSPVRGRREERDEENVVSPTSATRGAPEELRSRAARTPGGPVRGRPEERDEEEFATPTSVTRGGVPEELRSRAARTPGATTGSSRRPEITRAAQAAGGTDSQDATAEVDVLGLMIS